MIRSIEATGKTIDDAIENAIELLGVNREEVDVAIEIVDRPKSGFLGLGGTPAKVRASYDDGKPEPVAAKPAHTSAPAKKIERTERPEHSARPEHAARPERAERPEHAPLPEPVMLDVMTEKGKACSDRAVTFLNGLMERMGTTVQPVSGEQEDGTISIKLEGENLGMLIGRRGETLNAIQHITNYVVNKGAEDRTRIVVDIEDYRKKREDSLRKLALRTAGKVAKMRRNITLEPMNAYERHVIHTTLQDWRDVTTSSTGAEPRRAVVIMFTPGGGDSNRRTGSSERRDSRPPRRDRRDRPRTPRDDKPAEPRGETKPLEVKEFI